MATLIAVYTSQGCVGRCDARCYNAAGDNCQCVCGGTNHGKGLNTALANTDQMAQKWIEEYCTQRQIDMTSFEVKTHLQQMVLPGLDLPRTRRRAHHDHTRINPRP